MNTRFGNRNNNFRNDNRSDNRRHNGYQNGYQRNGWTGSRGHYECRSERDSKDVRNDNRNDSKQQSTHLPGIPVNRNQSSTPFLNSNKTAENSTNGSADSNSQTKVDTISEQMSQMDLKVDDLKAEEVAKGEDNVTNLSTDGDKSVTSSETKSESHSETKTETKDLSNSTSNGNNYSQRRNTIGTVDRLTNYRPNYRRNDSNQMNGQKFQYNNRIQSNGQFRANKGLTKKFTPQKNEFNPNYIPVNNYGPNSCEPYNSYPQFQLIPHPFPYYNPNSYGVPSLNTQMTPNTCDLNPESTVGRKQNDLEQSSKPSEQSKPNDIIQFSPHFVPFEPSPQFPVPPIYYGNIITYSTAEGMAYYFVSVVPPNIAPLALEIDSNGGPILPSNCHNVVSFPY